MATRAIIGYLNPDNTITTTYNHYDGYPDHLGVALDSFYSTDEKAKEIANMGYISYVDNESGDIEANNKERPVTIGDSDLVSSLQYFKKNAEGTDFVYLYIPALDNWVMSPTAVRMEVFVDTFMDELDSDVNDDDEYKDLEDDMMEEGYKTKWKKFITENDDAKVRFEKVRDNAYRMLKQEDGRQVEAYVDALERQIKFKPSDADEYIEYDLTDWKADFDDYVSDKMD